MLMRKPYVTRQIGLVCLALSLVFGYFARRAHLADSWAGGIQGLFLGIAIGTLLLSLRRRPNP